MNKLKKYLCTLLHNKMFHKGIHYFFIGLFTYFLVANIILFYKLSNYTIPKFIISRLSTNFNSAEYMHLVYTIQEINKLPILSDELYEYTTQPYDKNYSAMLENKLLQYNWTPEAFFVRAKKVFIIYNTYDLVTRLSDTISIMEQSTLEDNGIIYSKNEINVIKTQRQNIIDKDISFEEYEFMKSNYGLIQRAFKL